MMRTLSIAQREFASFFRQPIGWVVIALFMALGGVVFSTSIQPGAPATMRGFFRTAVWLLAFVAPAISMRLFSEELRSGTIEPLMTSPVSDWEIVFGKYLGGLGFLLAMLAPTLVFPITLELIAAPDYGPIVAGYAGLILLGALYLAVGVLFSATTSNQIVAFLATLFFLLFLGIGVSRGAAYLGPPADAALYALSPELRMSDFAKGVIDTSHVVFFLAAALWFLTLCVVTLEVRRWK
ncbi:MAG: ABC transporter permease subunit [Planctomycetota bacterium]|nr:ABC transporter permease subunit [Planctomycetota bacterium]